MLRVILVDDEALARQGLRDLLGAESGLEVVGEADSVRQAVALVETLAPDAIFLDIKMPDAGGFDLLQRLKNRPKVVFVTAYSQFAVQAFEFDAVDYLLKPIRPSRLEAAIQRLRIACNGSDPESESSLPYRASDRICLRTPGRTVMAPVQCVGALVADGDFTRVYVAGEPPIMICQSLGSYEQSLPNPPFVRLDRSFMVNIDRITRIEHRSRDETKLHIAGLDVGFAIGRKAWSTLRSAGVSDALSAG